jgi:hypothetical protein
MNDAIYAYGRPYHADDTRVLFCGAAGPWCGWLRTSNNAAQHQEYTKAREEHQDRCKGGLIRL